MNRAAGHLHDEADECAPGCPSWVRTPGRHERRTTSHYPVGMSGIHCVCALADECPLLFPPAKRGEA